MLYDTTWKIILFIAGLAAAMAMPFAASAQTAGAGQCPNGFVWRERYAEDHACVTPAERAKARAEREASCAPGQTCGQAVPAAASQDTFFDISGPRPFLVIAPSEFMPALQPLVAHKNSSGMPTVAVSVEQLTARFPGVDDPEKIKRGIQHAHEHLGTHYVMLVGDAHWFPVRYIFFKNFSRYYPGYKSGQKLPVDGVYSASDLYYANLYHHRISHRPRISVEPGPFDDWDGNRNGYYNEADWDDPVNPPPNANPDRVDGYPDVAVARATAHSAADVTAYVNKIIRYETEPRRPDLFTFIADGNYAPSIGLTQAIVRNSKLNQPSAFLHINTPDPKTPANWAANAAPADVAGKINLSVWVSYVGHGSVHGWDGNGFRKGLVKMTERNSALPVIFAAGCATARFAVGTPFDSEYVDAMGVRHKFAAAPGAGPDKPSVPAMMDTLTGQVWGAHCNGCNLLPLVAPKPNPYDFDRGNANFAYPWLFSYPDGGAIAYFGQQGIMTDGMAAELETYMLTDYLKGQRTLGEIYLRAERQYWEHHIDDAGRQDGHSPSRLFLGFFVMFGDPSLRMR